MRRLQVGVGLVQRVAQAVTVEVGCLGGDVRAHRGVAVRAGRSLVDVVPEPHDEVGLLRGEVAVRGVEPGLEVLARRAGDHGAVDAPDGARLVRPIGLVCWPTRNRYQWAPSSGRSTTTWTLCASAVAAVVSPASSSVANPASALSSQRTTTSSAVRPPSARDGSGARRVHSTTLVASGSPEATPSVNGSAKSTAGNDGSGSDAGDDAGVGAARRRNGAVRRRGQRRRRRRRGRRSRASWSSASAIVVDEQPVASSATPATSSWRRVSGRTVGVCPVRRRRRWHVTQAPDRPAGASLASQRRRRGARRRRRRSVRAGRAPDGRRRP